MNSLKTSTRTVQKYVCMLWERETEEKHKHTRGEIELFPYLFFQLGKYKNKTRKKIGEIWRRNLRNPFQQPYSPIPAKFARCAAHLTNTSRMSGPECEI